MKSILKPGLLVVGVVFALSAVFAAIMYFQGKSPSLPRVTSLNEQKNPVSEAPSSVVQPPRVEQRSVNIAFTDGEKNIQELEGIPLLTVTYQNDKPVEVVADGDKIRELVDKLPELTSEKPPVAAKLTKESGFSRIVRGEPGYTVDKNKTLSAFEEKIKADPEAEKLEIPVVINKTEGKEGFTEQAQKMGLNQLIAQFTTTHDADHINDENRNVNLRVAALKIDGLIIPPGGKFSFNKVVGPRTEQYGFKKAGVISQGRVIPGLGGGICQVSTTLYRAVLMSGMKVDERHNHSIYDGINYAERGFDAAVAWGYKDFRFTNNLDIPILIACSSGKGSVEIKIYAEKKPFDDIKLEARNEIKHPFQTQKKRNSALKKDQVNVVHPGVHGWTIEAYRYITHNGKTREEKLSKDRYMTYNRIEESNN